MLIPGVVLAQTAKQDRFRVSEMARRICTGVTVENEKDLP